MPINPAVYTNENPRPIDGPISAEIFFSRRSPISGIRPVPRLGLGTAFMVGLEPEGPVETLHAAWREGFDYADTAPLYGDAEQILGEALRQWKGERPVVATKTRRTESADEVRARFAQSCAGLGPVALLAVHDATPDYPPESRAAITDYVRGLAESGQIVAAGLGGGGPETQAQWLPSGQFRYVITHLRLDPVTLQGLHDSVPQARGQGAAVIAASPMHRGLFGPRHAFLCDSPPAWLDQVFVRRARVVNRLAQEWAIPLSQLAVRFALSLPMVDMVLTGAKSIQEWEDVRAAYEAGPLPVELYGQVWRNAQLGIEPLDGG